MTVDDMHIEFKVFLDKVDSAAYAEILEEEADIYLNEAQDRIIKTRYGINNIYKSGFEESQKRIDDLKNLVVTKYCRLTNANHYQVMGMNVVTAELSRFYNTATIATNGAITLSDTSPYEYMFFLKGTARCTNTCGNIWTKLKQVQHDDIAPLMNDPFNKPKGRRVLSFFEENGLYLWSEQGIVIDGFQMTFLRKPLPISLNDAQDCELSEHVHKEIVQLAVSIALENLESQRSQSQEIVNNRKIE